MLTRIRNIEVLSGPPLAPEATTSNPAVTLLAWPAQLQPSFPSGSSFPVPDLLAQARTPRVRVMMNIHKELPLSFPGSPPSPDPSHPLLHKYRDTTSLHRIDRRTCHPPHLTDHRQRVAPSRPRTQ